MTPLGRHGRLGGVVSQQHRSLEERVASYDQQEVFSRKRTMATRFGLTKRDLTTHFVRQLGVKRAVVRAFFTELERLAGDERPMRSSARTGQRRLGTENGPRLA